LSSFRLRIAAQREQFALHQLLYHFREAPYVVAFNSNILPDQQLPEAYQQIGWQLAVSYGEAFAPESGCFDALEALVNGSPDHYVGFLTYDLKNELEALHSAHADGIGFAPMLFFRPQLLISCHQGELVLERDELSFAAILPSILAAPLTEASVLPLLQFRRQVSDAKYLRTVDAIRQHITEGTVYELNYCMEWHAKAPELDLLSTYRRLNKNTKAPFSVYLKAQDRYLLSASPERFLRKTGQELLSQPIKGTIGRAELPADDKKRMQQLASDEKERAENVMIVDLVRNDLSRSCMAGSVEVPNLMQVYTFRTVHQMISTVKGQLLPDQSAVQAIRHAFPMGSMTGAPKIKAMEIIEALESSKRGLYSGAVGYFTPAGDFDFNVVIRSLQYNAATGYLSLMTGSAITHDSVPAAELQECLLKAEAILALFRPA
jgi:para-aminobenzoate synthetase component 1